MPAPPLGGGFFMASTFFRLMTKAGEVIAIEGRTAFGLAGRSVEESPGSPMARPAG